MIKDVVRHRTCGTCNCWRGNRHRCAWNYVGSAKLMGCKSGVQGIKEPSDRETPVEV